MPKEIDEASSHPPTSPLLPSGSQRLGYLKTTLVLIRIYTPTFWISWLLACCFAIAIPHNLAIAKEANQEKTIPSFAELEAAGALIGEISINTEDIFNLEDPEENNRFYRLVNRLHINTRPSVIKHSLLFKSGEPLSVRLIEESERLLQNTGINYEATIRPIAYHDGIVDIEVKTRDTWSLEPGIKYSRAGGTNTTGISIEERNLLGTGISVGLRRISDVDRSGSEFEFNDRHAFGRWYNLGYKYAKLSDGKRQSFSFGQPFYALDTRWAAGVSVAQDDRIESLYSSGIVTGHYYHSHKVAEVFGGWSKGVVKNWTRRYSIGLTYETSTYLPATTLSEAAPSPPNLQMTVPFVRYEVIENNFKKLRNRDLIERPEYVVMGVQSRTQIGRALAKPDFGSNLWIYAGSISNGLELQAGKNLLMSASISGKFGSNVGNKHLLSSSARYYMPRSERTLLFASIEGSALNNPDAGEYLQMGGDTGLRGYPLRYQSGDRSALLTVEQRVYSDWYPFRLLRIGGAIFYDVGRAWGGGLNQNIANSGWLNDIGFGLRILSARSAFGNVMHADLAFPLNRDAATKSFQFLLKVQTSF